METLFHYVAAPSRCGYLHDRDWSLEYEHVATLSAAEYQQRMLQGWRRFGTMLFRPACPACTACQAVRVPVDRFRPDRSQRRCRQANEGVVTLRIGPPSVTRAKLRLYDHYHAYQTDARGWPQHPAKDAASYADSFVRQPFAVEEWRYFLGDRLIGVGYVDALLPVPAEASDRDAPGRVPLALVDGEPLSGGMSAIYFFYDPEERQRSLGTWNVLCIIDEARRRGLPWVYLGYYVPGCRSMEYKPRFVPNELRDLDGRWRPFRE
jgi:arginine-tRNA-protein transferase